MNSRHVLLVEDNDKLAKLYQKVLHHSGYETRTVDNTEEAIAMLIEFDPATVFLDWQLKDGTCEPFLNHLQSLESANVPKIVIISAEVNVEDIDPYSDVVQQYFAKPVSIRDLVKNVSDE
jgi:DNA-binding response OmpR family regulator